MFNFDDINLENIVVHKIGSKTLDEGISFSKDILRINDDTVNELLLKYFLSPFKSELFHNFHHDIDLELNEVYNYVSKIFDNPDSFYEQSVHIAKHLYENSNHPMIKKGEFYMIYLHDCVVGDEMSDAIGFFKSENKDTYLKVYPSGENFEINCDDGININKLDKGCLIFNTEKEHGYKISIVDNLNKKNEAQYWKDDFLKLKPREDDFYHTKSYLEICKGFVENVYNDENNVHKTDQIDMLAKSAEFFKEAQTFNETEFENNVIQQPEVIEAFKDYKQQYVESRDMPELSEFEVSNIAVNKSKNFFRSILKLDKNFHVYVHGKSEYIERGFDQDKNLNYYKLFFNQEK